LTSLRRKIKKTFIYNTDTINAKNWFIVYKLPTNTKKCWKYFQKCYYNVTSGYRSYLYFASIYA